jgi:sRNA-binding carbon storage regulator CsrA
MLLLMRREGEAIRINENVTVEIKKINEEEVVFELQGITEGQVKLVSTEDEKK